MKKSIIFSIPYCLGPTLAKKLNRKLAYKKTQSFEINLNALNTAGGLFEREISDIIVYQHIFDRAYGSGLIRFPLEWKYFEGVMKEIDCYTFIMNPVSRIIDEFVVSKKADIDDKLITNQFLNFLDTPEALESAMLLKRYLLFSKNADFLVSDQLVQERLEAFAYIGVLEKPDINEEFLSGHGLGDYRQKEPFGQICSDRVTAIMEDPRCRECAERLCSDDLLIYRSVTDRK